MRTVKLLGALLVIASAGTAAFLGVGRAVRRL
jgi:hypothetical protein